MAVDLPRQDHVRITPSQATEQFVRFHEDKFDELLYEPDSTEFSRSFEPNPTLS